MSKDKDLVWLPKELVVKLKEVENEEELKEKYILKYIDGLKRDVSKEIELIDEDILEFKASCIRYKKGMKSIYDEETDALYAAWEAMDQKRGKLLLNSEAISKHLKPIRQEIDSLTKDLDRLVEKIDYTTINKFEKISGILNTYSRLDDDTKQMFRLMVESSNEQK